MKFIPQLALFTIGFISLSAQQIQPGKFTDTGSDIFYGNVVAAKPDHAPVANNDYFNAALQGFDDTIRANVHGEPLPADRKGFGLSSLSVGPAVQGGVDYDDNGHPLSEMTFTLFSGEIVYTSGACLSLDLTGNITWHDDGTFEYVRLSKCISRICFQYRLTDPAGLKSDTAIVVVDFLPRPELTVTFNYFSVRRNNNRVQLLWEIMLHDRVKGFFIQRNSGGRWIDRGYVPVGGSSSSFNGKYFFVDVNQLRELSEYRLLIVDVDGFVKLSEAKVGGGIQDFDVLIYSYPGAAGRGVTRSSSSLEAKQTKHQ